ncbi:transposase [Candidatus Enterovibrio escicola]|uniref:transposase n=1 Tax=Candidatus Enterovibrio escicola TaxID=1927127 RepID=UPI0012381976
MIIYSDKKYLFVSLEATLIEKGVTIIMNTRKNRTRKVMRLWNCLILRKRYTPYLLPVALCLSTRLSTSNRGKYGVLIFHECSLNCTVKPFNHFTKNKFSLQHYA